MVSWHVVASVSPHTTRSNPSTHTFSSIHHTRGHSRQRLKLETRLLMRFVNIKECTPIFETLPVPMHNRRLRNCWLGECHSFPMAAKKRPRPWLCRLTDRGVLSVQQLCGQYQNKNCSQPQRPQLIMQEQKGGSCFDWRRSVSDARQSLYSTKPSRKRQGTRSSSYANRAALPHPSSSLVNNPEVASEYSQRWTLCEGFVVRH